MKVMPSYPNAIKSLRPEAEFSIEYTDNGPVVKWENISDNIPTHDEIENELSRLLEEYDRLNYQNQRALEYPSIGDQLDALFHAGVFPPEMAAQIQAIKDKYPKGS